MTDDLVERLRRDFSDGGAEERSLLQPAGGEVGSTVDRGAAFGGADGGHVVHHRVTASDRGAGDDRITLDPATQAGDRAVVGGDISDARPIENPATGRVDRGYRGDTRAARSAARGATHTGERTPTGEREGPAATRGQISPRALELADQLLGVRARAPLPDSVGDQAVADTTTLDLGSRRQSPKPDLNPNPNPDPTGVTTGGVTATFIIRRGDQTVQLSKGSLLLGRSITAFAPQADSRVSRRHAQITAEGGRLWVTDLGSQNGTSVLRGNRRGEVSSRPVALQAGDRVIAADDVLMAEIATATATATATVTEVVAVPEAPAGPHPGTPAPPHTHHRVEETKL